VGRGLRLPRYTDHFLDRHGVPRFYLRRAGFKRVPLPGLPWSPEFMAAREAALKGEAAPQPIEIGISRTAVGSVDHAIVGYYGSTAFAELGARTRQSRRALLERFRAEHGGKPIARMKREHTAKIIHKLKPYAQRNMLKALRGLQFFRGGSWKLHRWVGGHPRSPFAGGPRRCDLRRTPSAQSAGVDGHDR
jgi:hypothetical protein